MTEISMVISPIASQVNKAVTFTLTFEGIPSESEISFANATLYDPGDLESGEFAVEYDEESPGTATISIPSNTVDEVGSSWYFLIPMTVDGIEETKQVFFDCCKYPIQSSITVSDLKAGNKTLVTMGLADAVLLTSILESFKRVISDIRGKFRVHYLTLKPDATQMKQLQIARTLMDIYLDNSKDDQGALWNKGTYQQSVYKDLLKESIFQVDSDLDGIADISTGYITTVEASR